MLLLHHLINSLKFSMKLNWLHAKLIHRKPLCRDAHNQVLKCRLLVFQDCNRMNYNRKDGISTNYWRNQLILARYLDFAYTLYNYACFIRHCIHLTMITLVYNKISLMTIDSLKWWNNRHCMIQCIYLYCETC